jgi:hypothetical protein
MCPDTSSTIDNTIKRRAESARSAPVLLSKKRRMAVSRRRIPWRLAHIQMAAVVVCLALTVTGEDENKRGSHDVEPFCRRSYIQVTRLWLTCDTPGAYYYGSNAYRNSEVCMSGDKANLEVECKSLSLFLATLIFAHFSYITYVLLTCHSFNTRRNGESSDWLAD